MQKIRKTFTVPGRFLQHLSLSDAITVLDSFLFKVYQKEKNVIAVFFGEK